MNYFNDNELKNKFDKEGYVVINQLIDLELIDTCLRCLEEFKLKKLFYFSQSNHIWEKSNVLTSTGFLPESIQNPSKLFLYPPLKKSVEHIISSKCITDILSILTGYDLFVRWQDMLFDKSTGTIDHADDWHLNTFPAGAMVAIWIALEDINEMAGRFYVIPKAQKYILPKYDELSNHNEYVKKVQNSINESGLVKIAPDLKKGDVIFWSAETIHGSYSQQDERYSRKSITAHYHPVGYARDKARTLSDIMKYMNSLIPTKNSKLLLDNTDPSISHIKINFLKFYIKQIFNLYRPQRMEMSRDKHIL
jgi:phytanoyl-CoA hydroxylase